MTKQQHEYEQARQDLRAHYRKCKPSITDKQLDEAEESLKKFARGCWEFCQELDRNPSQKAAFDTVIQEIGGGKSKSKKPGLKAGNTNVPIRLQPKEVDQ